MREKFRDCFQTVRQSYLSRFLSHAHMHVMDETNAISHGMDATNAISHAISHRVTISMVPYQVEEG